MDSTLVYSLLGALALAVALNLMLTFRLATIVGAVPSEEVYGPSLRAGDPVPDFESVRLTDGRAVTAGQLEGQPSVLLFLSSGCPACREKVPDIAGLQKAATYAGVPMWLVSTETERSIRNFLKDTDLAERVLLMNKAHRKALNPRNQTPFYLFVDPDRTLKASGTIGDANWLSFQGQLRDVEVEAGL